MYEIWIAALASSACIGFTSLVPWVFNLTFFEQKEATHGDDDHDEGGTSQDGRMKFLLSFALGAILGDIFFHLLPESNQSFINELNDTQSIAHRKVGISLLAGIFMFLIVEMMLEKWSSPANLDCEPVERDKKLAFTQEAKLIDLSNNNCATFNLKDDKVSEFLENNNDLCVSNFNTILSQSETIQEQHDDPKLKKHSQCNLDQIQINNNHHINDVAGYLNLIANGLDNFTHGLAIGASFLVGLKVGLLTTFVIFIHEVPHEICDFAILVNSGFSRLEAVKAQSSVSLFGILGTATALYVKSVDTLTAQTLWILPFSAGGFLYIALVNLLPELLNRNSSPNDSIAQVLGVLIGISFMGAVAFI